METDSLLNSCRVSAIIVYRNRLPKTYGANTRASKLSAAAGGTRYCFSTGGPFRTGNLISPNARLLDVVVSGTAAAGRANSAAARAENNDIVKACDRHGRDSAKSAPRAYL